MNPGAPLSAVRTQQSTRPSRPTKKGRISAALFVELPGIETGPKSPLNCVVAGFDDAKRRESTRNDLRIRAWC
jgi:hypothetical protein